MTETGKPEKPADVLDSIRRIVSETADECLLLDPKWRIDAPEDEGSPAPVFCRAAEPDEPFSLLAPDTASEMDEDALRDIVRKLVREELNGALGARMSRNVQRLVRNELRKALVNQQKY
ncbi:hypothetical protein C8N32_11175 [Rhodovulum imhoffii]|uniref:Uncharacterized protein n=1 Tax=Rhodovulum imhoffii TaxID=365340 RepID=A0A2T5BR10_9RHOB|nr:hypothetical protein [Rhodovulum imhoffii]MBK5934973.1 hypothetical protein [Rhodovulum imhoffii]PTN01676.1 hypothetical protein C8N32_11175 [Rhodovulum imhoffii]